MQSDLQTNDEVERQGISPPSDLLSTSDLEFRSRVVRLSAEEFRFSKAKSILRPGNRHLSSIPSKPDPSLYGGGIRPGMIVAASRGIFSAIFSGWFFFWDRKADV
jgi:hypothetical protein